jgi:tetratricopeptide (TPR) repeat protein
MSLPVAPAFFRPPDAELAHPAFFPPPCAACAGPCARRLVCARCKALGYCSRQCQTRHWTAGHRRECVPAAPRGAEHAAAFARASRLHEARDWPRVAALAPQFAAAARALAPSAPSQAMYLHHVLGRAQQELQDYAKAAEHFTHHLELAKATGNRAQECMACCNLAVAHSFAGEFRQAIGCEMQRLAIAREQGDLAEEARVCGNLGVSHAFLGEHDVAIRFHKLDLAIQTQTRDLRGEASASGNLGNTYHALGEYDAALALHERHLAIALQLGDGAAEGAARGNIGTVHESTGRFQTALECFTRQLALAEQRGSLHDEASARSNVGACLAQLHELPGALVHLRAYHRLTSALRIPQMQADAARSMGVVLTKQVRAHDGPPPPALVNQAKVWLNIAFDSGQIDARVHMARLALAVGQEATALDELQKHLSLLVNHSRCCCAGCGQTRGEHTPMRACSGCLVMRFCNVHHQKMASRKEKHGGRLGVGRHSDMCGVLAQWRRVLREGAPPESCAADLLAFLRRT